MYFLRSTIIGVPDLGDSSRKFGDTGPQVLVGRKALSLAALACLRSGLIVVIMVGLTNLTHFLFAQWYGRYVSDTCQRTFIVTPVWFPSGSSGLGWLGMGHGVQQPGYTDPTYSKKGLFSTSHQGININKPSMAEDHWPDLPHWRPGLDHRSAMPFFEGKRRGQRHSMDMAKAWCLWVNLLYIQSIFTTTPKG